MRYRLAKLFCKIVHLGQKRKYTGEPYWVHPFAVANQLYAIGLPEDVYIAGLLHDTVEDTWVTNSTIKLLFGTNVAKLVEEVTDVSKPSDGNRKARKEMDREHLREASADGHCIKLADLISNSQTIIEHDPNFAKVFIKEMEELLPILKYGEPYLKNHAMLIIKCYRIQNKEIK